MSIKSLLSPNLKSWADLHVDILHAKSDITIDGESIKNSKNYGLSAGVISGFDPIVDNLDGTVTIPTGDVYLRISNSDIADMKEYTVAAVTSLALSDLTNNYVVVDYNSGSPIILNTTVLSSIDDNTRIQLYQIFRDGTTLTITKRFQYASNTMKRSQEFIWDIHENTRTEGLFISDVGVRNIAISTGRIWTKLNQSTFPNFDTSVTDTFTRYYYNPAIMEQLSVTQWDNDNWNDTTSGLTSLTALYWSYQDFYVLLDNTVVCMYGQSEHALQDNANHGPVIPIISDLEDHAVYVGRLVFQKGASSGTALSPFIDVLGGGSASAGDHNTLVNLNLDNHPQYVTLINRGGETLDIDNIEANEVDTTFVENVGHLDIRAKGASNDLRLESEQSAILMTASQLSTTAMNRGSINLFSGTVTPAASTGVDQIQLLSYDDTTITSNNADVNIDAAANVLIDGATNATLTSANLARVTSGGTARVQGTSSGNARVTSEDGYTQLQTLGTGNIRIDSAADIDADSVGGIAVDNVTSGDIVITNTGRNMDVDATLRVNTINDLSGGTVTIESVSHSAGALGATSLQLSDSSDPVLQFERTTTESAGDLTNLTGLSESGKCLTTTSNNNFVGLGGGFTFNTDSNNTADTIISRLYGRVETLGGTNGTGCVQIWNMQSDDTPYLNYHCSNSRHSFHLSNGAEIVQINVTDGIQTDKISELGIASGTTMANDVHMSGDVDLASTKVLSFANEDLDEKIKLKGTTHTIGVDTTSQDMRLNVPTGEGYDFNVNDSSIFALGSGTLETNGDIVVNTGLTITSDGRLSVSDDTFPCMSFERTSAVSSGSLTTTFGLSSSAKCLTSTSANIFTSFGGGIVFSMDCADVAENVYGRLYSRVEDSATQVGCMQLWNRGGGASDILSYHAGTTFHSWYLTDTTEYMKLTTAGLAIDNVSDLTNNGINMESTHFENGSVHVNGTTVPTYSMLNVTGPTSSVTGPNFQLSFTGEAYPALAARCWTHGDVGLVYDSYFNGSLWKSSAAYGNVQLLLVNNNFSIFYDHGKAQGDTISLNTGLQLELDNQIFTCPFIYSHNMSGVGGFCCFVDSSGNVGQSTTGLGLTSSDHLASSSTYSNDLTSTSGGGRFIIQADVSGVKELGVNTDALVFDSNNDLFSPAIRDNSVGNIAVQIDSSTGELGVGTSVLRSKTNIEDIGNVDWIYNVNVKKFNYRKPVITKKTITWIEKNEISREKVIDEKGYPIDTKITYEEVEKSKDKWIKTGDYGEDFYPQQEYGAIAEDLEKIKPEFCTYTNVIDTPDSQCARCNETDIRRKTMLECTCVKNSELTGIEYSRFVPILIKAVQDQKKEIDDLKNTVNYLLTRVSILEA